MRRLLTRSASRVKRYVTCRVTRCFMCYGNGWRDYLRGHVHEGACCASEAVQLLTLGDTALALQAWQQA